LGAALNQMFNCPCRNHPLSVQTVSAKPQQNNRNHAFIATSRNFMLFCHSRNIIA
jgi:hypothetical protein